MTTHHTDIDRIQASLEKLELTYMEAFSRVPEPIKQEFAALCRQGNPTSHEWERLFLSHPTVLACYDLKMICLATERLTGMLNRLDPPASLWTEEEKKQRLKLGKMRMQGHCGKNGLRWSGEPIE